MVAITHNLYAQNVICKKTDLTDVERRVGIRVLYYQRSEQHAYSLNYLDVQSDLCLSYSHIHTPGTGCSTLTT